MAKNIKLISALKEYFGFDSFKGNQEAIIENLLAENDTFVLRPYYWGGNSRAARRPNFVFKPTGYQLKWYKYPLRDAYANKDISFGDFCTMLGKCAESVVQSAKSGAQETLT